jgi:cytochrome bd ubiquinol oxidase subunit I
MTPFLTAREASISLFMFCTLYSFIFVFGIYYLHHLLRAGPAGSLILPPIVALPNRPMSAAGELPSSTPHRFTAGE